MRRQYTASPPDCQPLAFGDDRRARKVRTPTSRIHPRQFKKRAKYGEPSKKT